MLHHTEDGKGNRRVFVDGVEYKSVLWADEDVGKICYAPEPYEIDGDEIRTKEVAGHVQVEFI